MFESLGYAERKVSGRQMLALPVAVVLQLALGTMYMAHYLFTPETLLPPATWISALPVIPITIHGETPRPPRDPSKDPVRPPKRDGLVQPDTRTLTPVDQASKVVSKEPVPGFGDDGPGVDGVPAGTDITGILPTATTEPQRQILQAWEVTPPRLLKQTQPAYPAAALAMRMGGKVVLQVVVDEEGRVTDVQVLSSTNALFNQSAADAVRQWQYTKPIAHGGQAVACYLTVVVNFQTR